jgi:hypothetical protein
MPATGKQLGMRFSGHAGGGKETPLPPHNGQAVAPAVRNVSLLWWKPLGPPHMSNRFLTLIVIVLWVLITPAGAQFTEQRTWGGTTGGSANAQTITIPNYTAHLPGVPLRFKAGFTNTGPTTINISGLGAANLLRQTVSGTAALIGGEIVGPPNAQIYTVVYDGSAYQLIGTQPTVAQRTVTGAGGSVVPTDCGNEVILSASGVFFPFLIGDPSTLPIDCKITVRNVDGTRGKGMQVFGLASETLWPQTIRALRAGRGNLDQGPVLSDVAGDRRAKPVRQWVAWQRQSSCLGLPRRERRCLQDYSARGRPYRAGHLSKQGRGGYSNSLRHELSRKRPHFWR